MTAPAITRTQLLESFSKLQSSFTSSLEEAQRLEVDFDLTRRQLTNAISAHLQTAQNGISNGNPLQAQLNEFVSSMGETQREWDSKVAGRDRYVEFRQGFEDSLLVFVGGKVKSGKSSLGNFMAWGHTDPTPELKHDTAEHLRPTYKSHERVDVSGGDQQNEAQNRKEFRVGATEATSSIQSFTLPGLTWVDSPGLHSMKAENGQLARDYLDHADLILYTMSSDAPGRASDIDEVRDLFRKNKRVIVLLTGSDDNDFVEVNGSWDERLVMKSPKRCASQKEEVLKQLQTVISEDMLQSIEIVSISARYAQTYASNPSALNESGIGLLCSTLNELCQSEGVAMKRRVPMYNLRNFLINCKEDLLPYQTLMQEFTPALASVKKKLTLAKTVHIRAGEHELARFINQFFDGLAAHRNDEATIHKEVTRFRAQVQTQSNRIWEKQLDLVFADLVPELRSAIKSTYSKSNLAKKIPDFKVEKVTQSIPEGTRSGTKRRNAGIGSLLGTGVGFLLGGPVGAGIGAMAGGALGGMTGDDASVTYRDVEISVGDNLSDIRQTVLQTHCDALTKQMEYSANQLWQEMEVTIQKMLDHIANELNEFDNHLKYFESSANQALKKA